MKKIIFIFISIVLVSCNSTKSTINKIPLETQKATFQRWFGGREGVRGIKIEIIASENISNCTYKTIYFRNKKARIYNDVKNNIITLTANINTARISRDKILSSNKNKEFNNEPPTKPKYPNLKDNEAVIEYLLNDKLSHFTITLSEKKPLYYQ